MLLQKQSTSEAAAGRFVAWAGRFVSGGMSDVGGVLGGFSDVGRVPVIVWWLIQSLLCWQTAIRVHACVGFSQQKSSTWASVPWKYLLPYDEGKVHCSECHFNRPSLGTLINDKSYPIQHSFRDILSTVAREFSPVHPLCKVNDDNSSITVNCIWYISLCN